MAQTSRTFDFPQLPQRTRVVLLFGAAIALLVVYGTFVLSYQNQRQAERRLETQLFRYQSFVATTAPTVEGVEELQSQLSAAQVRLATSRAQLPAAGEQVDVVQSVVRAGRQHSVEITRLEIESETTTDVVREQRYNLQAAGSLANVLAFSEALETEVLPSSRLENASVRRMSGDESGGNQQDRYMLTAGLLVLTTQDLVTVGQPTPDQAARAEQLRTQYEQAMAEQDYERALSLLTRLSLVTSTDQDALLYDTHVEYGQSLLEDGFLARAEEQFTLALAIRPEGEEAILGLLQVSEQQTQTPEPGETVGAGLPSRTPGSGELPATPTPTEFGRQPTSTLPPTQPPPPTNTRGPTNTPRPTQPLVPTNTPTVTNTPAPTGTPNPYKFGAEQPFYLPNCGVTMVRGTVKTQTGQPLNGVTVRVWWDGAGPEQAYSRPSGTDPTKPNGYWDVVLDSGPKVGKWYVTVVDRDTGAALSETTTVNTDVGPCQPGGDGKQVVIVDFVRFAGEIGTPAPTSTATRVPTNTRIPSSTPTETSTPTVTPTATRTPLTYRCSDCPQGIPDDITTPLESEINVDEDVIIRKVRVFVWLTHEDINDIRIELLAPNGERFTLREEPDSGSDDTELRTRYTIDSDRIEDENAQGAWTLILTDTKPGREGELLDWNLELFP